MQRRKNLINQNIEKSTERKLFSPPSKIQRTKEMSEIINTAKKNLKNRNDQFLPDETIKKKFQKPRTLKLNFNSHVRLSREGMKSSKKKSGTGNGENIKKQNLFTFTGNRIERNSNKKPVLNLNPCQMKNETSQNGFHLFSKDSRNFSFKIIKKDAPKSGKSTFFFIVISKSFIIAI